MTFLSPYALPLPPTTLLPQASHRRSMSRLKNYWHTFMIHDDTMPPTPQPPPKPPGLYRRAISNQQQQQSMSVTRQQTPRQTDYGLNQPRCKHSHSIRMALSWPIGTRAGRYMIRSFAHIHQQCRSLLQYYRPQWRDQNTLALNDIIDTKFITETISQQA